jgi:TP53 regulating kinase and related kinases
MVIISQGAEAILTKEGKKVIKDRIVKSYRLPVLDEQLRKKRTKSEAKILEKLQGRVNVPKIFKQDKFSIEIEFLEGDRLSESLNNYPEKKQIEVMKNLAKEVSKMHDLGIIHGDLTTSNVILKENKVYIIDFGLSFHSLRIEDKAVDLHLIKQALEAKHWQNHEKLFKSFISAYKPKDKSMILKQLKEVESRGRYKH